MFQDREQAGRHLAAALQRYITDSSMVVALPRGGVPVGFEVAKAFQIPLYVLIARKIGAPGHEELGIGAIAEDGVIVLDRPTIYDLQVSPLDLEQIIGQEQEEMSRRVELYRKGKKLPNLSKKTVILVDDGLATGVTAKAAIETLKKMHTRNIIFAAPVCAKPTTSELERSINSVVCLLQPQNLYAIGMYYQNFAQITDEQVIDLLKKAKQFDKEKPHTYH